MRTPTDQRPSVTKLAPIPHLAGYYPDPDQRAEWTRALFDETADDYDRVERWFSFGTGGWYRRRALVAAGLRSGMRVLDVGTGTGLVAREAVAVVGPSGSVVGVDPSEQMLQRAAKSLGIRTIRGTAESLPFENESFDFLTLGYAMRHLSDLNAAFAEFARVLKPGGTACVLEVVRPSGRLAACVLRAYFRGFSRLALSRGRVSERTRELWRYYGETIERCVPSEQVVEAMGRAGLVDTHRSVSLGIFAEYIGKRAGQ